MKFLKLLAPFLCIVRIRFRASRNTRFFYFSIATGFYDLSKSNNLPLPNNDNGANEVKYEEIPALLLSDRDQEVETIMQSAEKRNLPDTVIVPGKSAPDDVNDDVIHTDRSDNESMELETSLGAIELETKFGRIGRGHRGPIPMFSPSSPQDGYNSDVEEEETFLS